MHRRLSLSRVRVAFNESSTNQGNVRYSEIGSPRSEEIHHAVFHSPVSSSKAVLLLFAHDLEVIQNRRTIEKATSTSFMKVVIIQLRYMLQVKNFAKVHQS